MGDRFAVASKKVARQYYLNAGVISDSVAIRVVMGNNRRLGEVEESFLAAASCASRRATVASSAFSRTS